VSLQFSKYQGCGNDFLLVHGGDMTAGLARALCDRHFGVGADGVIVIGPPRDRDAADFSFLLYNADGGIAELSGNGLRCVGAFLYDRGLHQSTTIRLEAAGQVRTLDLVLAGGTDGGPSAGAGGGRVTGVRVDMGVASEEGEVELHGLRWKLVTTGNPHAVTFVDRIEEAPVEAIGPLVENDPMFPNRTNVEFVSVAGPETLDVRFWERGVGVTLASGTGSCASVVASGLPRATVRTLGGDLRIERRDDAGLTMTGPAEHVFDGTFGGTLGGNAPTGHRSALIERTTV
jgi:diaminopimelate epimerase